MAKTASTAAAELVARFRRQRPLRGGSLIVTIFGDAIMPRGGAISLGSLIEVSAPFSLNERLVRTATARLAQDGWLEGRRTGKLSEYHLSSIGRERFAEATHRIYGEPQAAWSGRWTLAVLPPMPAAERKALREEFLWRGFGEISAGVFAHPQMDSRSPWTEGLSRKTLSKIMVFDAALTDGDAADRLVGLGWDLDELGVKYQRFVERFEKVRAALDKPASVDDQSCFIIRTLLIHEYRRLHLRDPMLPARLLQDRWPGARSAELCRDIYARVFTASENYLSRSAALLDGPLPAPEASVMQRFGGIGLAYESPSGHSSRVVTTRLRNAFA